MESLEPYLQDEQVCINPIILILSISYFTDLLQLHIYPKTISYILLHCRKLDFCREKNYAIKWSVQLTVRQGRYAT